MLVPKFFFQMRLRSKLVSVSRRKDYEYIRQRVDYYNKLSDEVKLPTAAARLSEHKIGRQKVYFLILISIPGGSPISFSGAFVPVM